MKIIKVLIVDDVASMRKFLKFGLEKTFPRVTVDEAANGKDAQLKLEKTEYDLVLCDWEMPFMNGEELLTWLRNHPTLSKTPFIMVTSRNDKPSVLKALHGGANSYVVKPFTANSLAQKVMSIVDHADRREQERVEAHGSANVHFSDRVTVGSLIDISLGGLFAVFERKNPIPAIFEKVLIEINFEDSQKVDGLEGFVIRMQAAEAFIDSENVKIAIKFLELPDKQKKDLEKILNEIKQ
jgi:CheY-like chemotaxis protein